MVRGFTEAIITAETNPIRFERFCIAACEKLENVTIFRTSLNYDQARDGRSISPAKGSHRIVLCVTLSQDLDEKVRADLSKIAVTTKPDRLIYCCSQPLTEHRIDALTAEIRSYVPRASISVISTIQLADLAEKFPEIFGDHYPGEIELIKTRLLAFQATSETAEQRGLRLALIAFGSEDAVALRKSISCRAIVEVLQSYPRGASVKQVAEHLSTDLRLPQVLNAAYIEAVLKEGEEKGLTARHHGLWVITAQGSSEAKNIPTEAAKHLLSGRAIIRAELEHLTGSSMTDSQFEVIWTTLLDFLSDLFYSNGIAVINAINEFLNAQEGGKSEAPGLERMLDEGAGRIAARMAIPEVAEDVEQAIRDMFTLQSGPAFDWLTAVCERFVALCALGLEASSGAELKAVIARYQLVLDTDVVITLLCAGERFHSTNRELLARFRQIGGQVLVSPPVLEEVAYHAYISEGDYDRTKQLAGKLRAEEMLEYADNAFVRGFLSLTSDPRKWQFYRSQFVGHTPRDYSRILSSLQDELMVQVLPAKFDPDLARRISELSRHMAERSGVVEVVYERDIGKSGRDGQLLASVASARAAHRETGSNRVVVLLSSSSRLRAADRRFRSELGTPESVISPRTLAYMLAQIADVGFGAGALRQALFDFGDSAHLSDIQRFALRVIRGSTQYDMPWAKRRRLQEELERVLRSEAQKHGITEAVARQKFLSGDESIHPENVIATALGNMAMHTKTEDELNRARMEIRRLKGELRDTRASLEKAARDQRK